MVKTTTCKWCATICLIVMMSFGMAQAAEEGKPRMEKLEPLLQQAIDRYEQKQYRQAQAKLDEILALDPTNNEAYMLRELVGQKILGQMAAYMRQGHDLGKGPIELLRRAKLKEQDTMLQPDKINSIVMRATSGDTQALAEIRRIGQYAVPALIRHLKEKAPQTARINASFILSAMGRTAVSPLYAALDTDDKSQLLSILQVLDKIRPIPQRVLPKLKAIHDDPQETQTIILQAARTLKRVTQQEPAQLKPAPYYFHMEANRYYLGSETVDEEVTLLNNTFWAWDPAKQELVYSKVPHFILAGLLAEDAVYTGMALAPADESFTVLLSSLYMQQKALVEHLFQSLETSSLSRPDLAVMKEKTAQWQAHLNKNLAIASTIGPKNLLLVLQKALLDKQKVVAVSAIKAIEKTARWKDIGNDIAPVKEIEEEEEEDTAPTETMPTVATKESVLTSQLSRHPLIQALNFPNRHISVAAANCLLKIGYPKSGPNYNDLLPKLVEGAAENAAPVALIISNDTKLREDYERMLSTQGIRIVSAPNGRYGIQAAMQFPPKDAIFIDGNLDEFTYLRSRLAMMPRAKSSPLPLTIITSADRVERIVSQFTSKQYHVEVLAKIKPDTPNLFKKLSSLKGSGNKTKVLVLTNENAEARARIKQILEEKIQELLDPTKNSSNVSFALYGNIFLDEDLSGYDAKRTVMALRSDPRTRNIMVGLLSTNDSKERLQSDFKELLKQKELLRLINSRANAEELARVIKTMSEAKDKRQINYLRQTATSIAVESSAALNQLKINGQSLTPEQIEMLKDILRTRTDIQTRVNVTKAIARFKIKDTLPLLAKIATSAEATELRVATIESLGSIDTEGKFRDVKLKLLEEDSNLAIQSAAAQALSMEKADQGNIVGALTKLRVNDPLNLKLAPVKATTGSTAATPAETAKPADEEKAEEEDKTSDESEEAESDADDDDDDEEDEDSEADADDDDDDDEDADSEEDDEDADSDADDDDDEDDDEDKSEENSGEDKKKESESSEESSEEGGDDWW